MIIAAFDPGGTTGAVLWNTDQDLSEVRLEQLGPEHHHEELWDLLQLEWLPDLVVTESFEYRNTSRAGLRLDSVEYIGVLRLWCSVNGVPLVSQTASQAKGLVKEQNLERLGFKSSWSTRHQLDALRHLLYYVVTTMAISQAEILEKGWK